MINKALIPAAGLGTRFLPATKAMAKEMLPIVDKPTLQYIVEEAVAAGINEIILVINDNKESIKQHFANNQDLVKHLKKSGKDELADIVESTNSICKFTYVVQEEQKGLGHAILVAKEAINGEDFAVLLGDDLVKSDVPAIKQCIDAFEKTGDSIIGVQEVEDRVLNKYGVVAIECGSGTSKLTNIVEKPKTLDLAPSNRAALGRYVFRNDILDHIAAIKEVPGQEIQLTDAILTQANEGNVSAHVFEGRRYDIGSKEGFVEATIDYALEIDGLKEHILDHIREVVAKHGK